MYKSVIQLNYYVFGPQRRIKHADIVTLQEVCKLRVSDIAWYLGDLRKLYGNLKHQQTEVESPIISMIVRFLCNNEHILQEPLMAKLEYHPVDIIPTLNKQKIPYDRKKLATLFGKNYYTVCNWMNEIYGVAPDLRKGKMVGREMQRLCELIIMTVERDGLKAFGYWMDIASMEGSLRGNEKAASGGGW